jgi:hypothetical protein
MLSKSGQMTLLNTCARSASMVARSACTRSGWVRRLPTASSINGQRGDVVEVAVREHDIVDARHLVEGEVADAGARIDEQVRVDQERGRAAVFGDGA